MSTVVLAPELPRAPVNGNKYPANAAARFCRTNRLCFRPRLTTFVHRHFSRNGDSDEEASPSALRHGAPGVTFPFCPQSISRLVVDRPLLVFALEGLYTRRRSLME